MVVVAVYLCCAWCEYSVFSGSGSMMVAPRLPGLGWSLELPLQCIAMPLLLFSACQVRPSGIHGKHLCVSFACLLQPLLDARLCVQA